MKTKAFTSMRNSHRTLQLTAENFAFLQNVDLRFLMDKIICSILTLLNFTSCKHRHRYYTGIIQIFEQLRISLSFQSIPDLKMLRS